MKRTLILLVGLLAILGISHTLALPSWAIDYPTKPITLLVAYGPGGAADILARAMAPELERSLGQPVVVLNKPGASGSIGMGFLASAKPDGYTIAISPASLALTPYFQQVSYNVEKDFTFIAALGNYTEPFFVRADSPFKTLENLVDHARQNPDRIKIGVPGMATSAALMGKFVGEKAGVRWTLIPFTSDAENITSLLGGHIHVGILLGGYAPHLKAGTVRMLAVNTAERIKDCPDIPTLIECGYNFTTLTLVGIVGPKGLPEAIFQKLAEAIAKARQTPIYLETIKNINLNPLQQVGKDYEKSVMENYRNMGKYSKPK